MAYATHMAFLPERNTWTRRCYPHSVPTGTQRIDSPSLPTWRMLPTWRSYRNATHGLADATHIAFLPERNASTRLRYPHGVCYPHGVPTGTQHMDSPMLPT